MTEETLALDAIRKKLVGKELTYKEIFAVMDQISRSRLGDILTTYFAASGYSKGFSDQEIYYLTKAMVETGQKLEFSGIVADKHSIGGVPGTRTTMIVVPIIAAAGYTIPKSSSRAITTPGGTADDMEVLSPVTFTKEQIYKIVKKTNGCIVWGGGFKIAPADDVLIKVEEPLLFESFDKVLVSIMAKKIAFGSNHVVIDLPYGRNVKVHSLKDAHILANKFEELAKKFNIKIKVLAHPTYEPAGRGVGPVLETREALRVLEQSPDRPLDLEKRSLNLAGHLLDLCLLDSPQPLRDEVKKLFGNGHRWAEHLLSKGYAHSKMKEIIDSQGGNLKIKSEDLALGKNRYDAKATQSGKVSEINSKNLTIIAKILGAPKEKTAGIYLNKKIREKFEKGEILFSLYTNAASHLEEAKNSLANFPIILYD